MKVGLGMIVGLLISMIEIVKAADQVNSYKVFPKKSVYFTVDCSDIINLDINGYFIISNQPFNLGILCTGPGPKFEPLDAADLPTFQFLRSSDGFPITESRWVLQMTGFGRIKPIEPTPTEFCLFVWNLSSGQQSVNFTEEGCLNVNLRVVNNSLDFTDIENFLYGKKFSISASGSSQLVKFSTFTRGQLPESEDYSMRCENDKKIPYDEPPEIPSILPNGVINSAISSREIYLQGVAEFTGTQQVYLDGYIIDYDLEKGVFSIWRYGKAALFIIAIHTGVACKQSSFLSDRSEPFTFIRVACHIENITKLYQASLTSSENVGTQLYSAELPGNYSHCARKFEQYQTIISFFCNSYQNFGEPTKSSNYVVFKVSRHPFLILDSKSYPISGFEDEMAKEFGIPIGSFSLEMVPTFSANQYFWMKYSASLYRLVVFSEFKRFSLSWNFTDPIDAGTFCITANGLFYRNSTEGKIYFYHQGTNSRFLVRTYQVGIGTNLIQSTCVFERDLWLLKFGPYYHQTLVLVSGSADLTSIDATNRIQFVRHLSIHEAADIFYLDQQTNSLVWHTFPGRLGTTIKEHRFSLAGKTSQTLWIQIWDTGSFTCSIGFSYNEKNWSNGHQITLVSPANFSLEIFNSTPTFSLPASQSTVNLDIPISVLFSTQGPILNSRYLYSTKLLEQPDVDYGSIYLEEYYRLEDIANHNCTFQVPFFSMLVNSRVLFVSSGDEVSVMTKDPNSERPRFTTVAWSRLEFYNQSQHDYRYSKVFGINYLFIYGNCLYYINLDTFKIFDCGQTDSADKSFFWRILAIVEDIKTNTMVVLKEGWSKDTNEFQTWRCIYKHRKGFLSEFDFDRCYFFQKTFFLGPSNQSILMDTYWNEDDQTYHMISLVPWGDRMFLRETQNNQILLSLKDLRIQPVKIGSQETLVSVMNCSAISKKCFAGLETNLLVMMDLEYDSASKTYTLQQLDETNVVYYPIALLGKIQRIICGRKYLMIHDDLPGSGIFVYSMDSLASPVAVIKETYQAPMMAWFGLDCPPEEQATCENEVILVAHPDLPIQMYRISNMTLKLRRIPRDLLTPGLNVSLEFNTFDPLDPQYGVLMSGTNSTVYLQFSFSEPQLASVLNRRVPVLAKILLLVALILVASLMMINYVGYHVKERDKKL